MARYLFTTWEGGGHVQPMLLVARDLAARGHAVLAVSDPCNAPDAAALNVPFRAWTTAPFQTGKTRDDDRLKDHEADNPLEVIQRLLDRVMAGPALAYAEDTLAAIDAFAPDVVVSQELLLGSMAAAQARGLPLALLAANVWSLPTLAGAPPLGAGMLPATTDEERAMHAMVGQMSRTFFQAGLPDLNAARAALGLPPLVDLFEQLDAAKAILLATSRAFDFAPDPLPVPFAHVGPYLADPAWVEPFAPPPGDTPLVVVSFSSLYQAQEPALRAIIAALGQLPVRGVVTTGPTLDPARFEAPANVAVVRGASHGDLLKDAALFVTHAGHGSTLRPLMAGVPLLCLPMGRDQNDNAARVVHRGAGLTLPADADAETVAAAVRRLLDEPTFRAAADVLGAAIRADEAARDAAAALEALAT
ncbi:glycosyl transferase [Caulobacter sp. Root487D2Y]|uniref:glycosyltransferase n=1 Tax=Caulobacter sp. Root487D2Y TaxID=1736547 RepID=UPI000700E02B|nr:glycosyltransferase [Caulobacter sp. Root487D2Y]KQY28202.1 glycosyl transferase [Caulobacter sp. Root487D2Y]